MAVLLLIYWFIMVVLNPQFEMVMSSSTIPKGGIGDQVIEEVYLLVLYHALLPHSINLKT